MNNKKFRFGMALVTLGVMLMAGLASGCSNSEPEGEDTPPKGAMEGGAPGTAGAPPAGQPQTGPKPQSM
ncbi:MAG: hypothetical protein OHK0029_31530 [Armatimonadaceae bacterium]